MLHEVELRKLRNYKKKNLLGLQVKSGSLGEKDNSNSGLAHSSSRAAFIRIPAPFVFLSKPRDSGAEVRKQNVIV